MFKKTNNGYFTKYKDCQNITCAMLQNTRMWNNSLQYLYKEHHLPFGPAIVGQRNKWITLPSRIIRHNELMKMY